VALPLRLRGELVGILTAGAKRTGLFYTAGDAEFLRALAQQAAIALENARTYEALALLNARLEDRVHERTAQLEETNRELTQAYGELKSAETRLVHSEKMASLGRLVAGVAHEINNPVSFISNSVAPLTRRLQQAAASAPPHTRGALREAEELAGIMARRGRHGERRDPRRRGRHPARRPRPHLRPLLHHQGRGPRDGARARGEPRGGGGPRRADRRRERARRREHLPRQTAGRCGGHAPGTGLGLGG